VTRLTTTTPLNGQRTVVACWRALGTSSPGSIVLETPESVVALFPSFAPWNNAIVLSPHEVDLAAEVEHVSGVYRHAQVDSWAFWIPSPEVTFEAADAISEIPGLTRDTTTLVMEANASENSPVFAAARAVPIDDAIRATDEPVPTHELGDIDIDDARLAGWVAVDGDVAIAGAYRYLHGSDCGIYAVGTVPDYRRRGIAGRLVAHIIRDAARRGARTATLQSVRTAQRLYESLGFEAVGRYEEWVPA
jgi:ribosomal protein S18 acetylase RimI-like enzyme